MAFDPLSDTTRKARRSLLGMASAAIVTRTFNVRIEDIPLVGIKIAFGPELLEFVFFMGLTYFFVSFLIYCSDDLINVGVAPLEERKLGYLKAWENDVRGNLESFLRMKLRHKYQSTQIKEYADDIFTRARALAFSSINDDQVFREELNAVVSDILPYVEHHHDRDLPDTASLIMYASIRQYEGMKEKRGLYPAFGVFRLYVLELGIPVMLAVAAFLVIFNAIQLQWLVKWFSA